MKKRILSILMSLAMVLSIAPVGAFNLTASAATSGNYTYEVSGGKATITYFPTSYSGSLTIPSTLGGYTVTSIGAYAFDGCSSLQSVTIPDSVTSIGSSAFYYCSSLTSVTIPDSVTSIGSYAFSESTLVRCSKNSYTATWCQSQNQLYYFTDATDQEAIVSGIVGKFRWTLDKRTGVLNIAGGGNMIDFTSANPPWYEHSGYVTTLEFSGKITKIGEKAFYGCSSLTSVTIPDSVTSIGDYAFSDCDSLTSVTIGNSVTSIGSFAFYGCDSLTSVTIPDSVTSIGRSAFRDCYSLQSVTIGNSVTSIGFLAFDDCSRLKDVYITDLAAWCNIYFMDSSSNPLYYADNLYINGALATDVVIPQGVTTISPYLLSCSNLKSVTIPDSVTSIGARAFYACSSLKEFIIFSKNCGFNSNCGLNYNHTIYGFKGSTAETFAEEIGAEFIELICDHDYTAATCTKAKICKMCGETSGKALGHTYKSTVTEKANFLWNGSATETCINCGKFSKKVAIRYVKYPYLSATTYTYNGKVITPTVTVKDSAGNKLINGVDYTVSYASGRKNVGTYKVTVTLKGNYSGKEVLTFKINPPKTSIKKLTASKKSLKVTVGKQTKEVTGYEIQYSTSKKFKSAKKVTIKKAKTTSATIKKLKAKKTYYVRVRTYKTVNGKKYYSTWSTYKSKKTK